MPFNELVASFCEDPKNPYQVKSELKVRKMLEKHTSWHFEFSRNEFKHGVDILAYKYVLRGNEYKKIKVGKIEVEVSKLWMHGIYPKNWKATSYLRRKVEKFDLFNVAHGLNSEIWKGEEWDDASETIYLKCAIDMSDCHCALVSDIWGNKSSGWMEKDKREGITEDRAWYIRFRIEDDPVSIWGWESCIAFSINVFESRIAGFYQSFS